MSDRFFLKKRCLLVLSVGFLLFLFLRALQSFRPPTAAARTEAATAAGAQNGLPTSATKGSVATRTPTTSTDRKKELEDEFSNIRDRVSHARTLEMVAFVPREDDLGLRLHLLVKLKKAQVKFKMSPVMLKGGSATSAGAAENGAALPGVVSSTVATTAGVVPSLLQDIAKHHVAPTTRSGKNTPSRKTSLLWRLEEVNFLFYAEDELVKRADFLAKKLPAEKNCAIILSRDGKLALLLHEKITPSAAGSGTGPGLLTSCACVDEASFVFRHKSDLRTLAGDDEQTSLDGTTMTTAAGAAVLAATKNRVTQADVKGYGPQLHGPPFQYEDGFAAEDEEESAVVTDWVMETPSDVIFGGPQSRTAARNFVFVFVMSCVVLCCSYVWGSLLGPFARRRSVILQGGGSGPGGNFLLGVGGRDADLEESTARILQDPGHSDSEDVGPPPLKDLRHSRVDDADAGDGPLRQIAKLPAVISSKQKKRTQRDGYGQLALTPASPEVPAAAVVGRNSGVLPPPRISEGPDAELRLVAPEHRQELSQLATPSSGGRNADPSSSISRPADARRPPRHDEEMPHTAFTRRAILLQVSLAALFLSIIFATAHAAYYLVYAHLDLLPPKLFWGANDGLRYFCRVEPGKKFTSSALPKSSSFRQAYCTQEFSDTFRQFELLFVYKLSFVFLLWMFSEKVIGQAIWEGGSFADTVRALGMRGAWAGASEGAPGEDEAMEEGGGSALTARTVAE